MTGDYPQTAESGVFPTGWEEYASRDTWRETTTIGGVWDVERDNYGVGFAIGVHFTTGWFPGDMCMCEVDAALDDGVLATGRFRKLASDRFYFILEGP